MTQYDFWHATSRTFNAYIEAYKIRKRERDYENWLLGAYIQSAVSVAIEHNINGKKAKSKYIDKPFFEKLEEQQKMENLTEEEKIAQTKQLFMRLKIMQSNFELKQKNKDGSAS